MRLRLRLICESIVSIEHVVLHELECAAMKGVRTGLGNDYDLAGIPSRLRARIDGLNVELRYGLNVGNRGTTFNAAVVGV